MKNSRLLIVCMLCAAIFACKNEVKDSAPADALSQMEATLKSEPTLQNANKYLSEITRVLPSIKDDSAKFKSTLDKGIALAEDHNVPARSISFLLAYLKEFPKDPSSQEKMYKLASLMKGINKGHASNVLITAYAQRFPNDAKSKDITSMLTEPVADINQYVVSKGEQIFENPDQFGINKNKGQMYVDVCEAYALGLPDSDQAPVNLYKAAEIARTLRTFPKTLSIYDWIINKYPAFDKAPTALFLKGFIIENELKNTKLAKSMYEEFLQKYPSHDLADDVKFLVENIGKSNEEILQLIEDKKAEKVAK